MPNFLIIIFLLSSNILLAQKDSEQVSEDEFQQQIKDEAIKHAQEEGKSYISKILGAVGDRFKDKLSKINILGDLKASDVKRGLIQNSKGTYLESVFNKSPKIADFISEVIASKEARDGLFKIPSHPSKWTKYLIGFIGLWVFFWWIGGVISKSLEGFFKRLIFWFSWKALHFTSLLFWFGNVFSEELNPIAKIFYRTF